MKQYIILALVILCFSVTAYGSQNRSISFQIQGFNIAAPSYRHRANVVVSEKKNYYSKWRWDGANLRLILFNYPNPPIDTLCLNAYRPRKGSNVNIYACNKKDPEQHWAWLGDGWIKLIGTNLCLNSYLTREGSNLNMYPCDRSDMDQKFRILRNVRP